MRRLSSLFLAFSLLLVSTQKDRADCPVVGARAPVDYRVVPKCKAAACVVERVPK